MKLLIYLVPGLLLGVALNRCGFGSLRRVRRMLAFRDVRPLRCLLLALGTGMALSALLMWLAVIDVDEVRVLPLHGGTLIGGVIAGLALGLTGISPGTSITAMGSGNFVYGLCGVMGCLTGAAALQLLEEWVQPVRDWLPASEMTLFATTLDHPFLLDGRFLGLACLGAVIMVASLLLPRRRIAEEDTAEAEPAPVAAPEPETLPEDTFVATLPEEEAIVIDTAVPEEQNTEENEEPPEDDEESIRELALLDGEMPQEEL